MYDRETVLGSLETVPAEYWKKLSEKKIFFGHQSVGFNIIDGIKDLMKEDDNIKLNIVETTNPEEFDNPIFAHARIEENTNPLLKIKNFQKILDSGIGKKVDIALLKFCYIDIDSDTDVERVFNEYRRTMDELSNRYPDTIFLHVTVPLRSGPKGFKSKAKNFIKLLTGESWWTLDCNVNCHKYNAMLNDTYLDKHNVFDLAYAETIKEDGSKSYMKKDGKKVFVLLNEYTYDGGHLNERGRKFIAEQLLIKLAEIAGAKY